MAATLALSAEKAREETIERSECRGEAEGGGRSSELSDHASQGQNRPQCRARGRRHAPCADFEIKFGKTDWRSHP
jgi:hypothetical protein